MVTTKRTGPANLRPHGLAVAVTAAFLPLAAHGQITSTTLPTGFNSVAGGASVVVNGSTMTVNSASNAEINNWQTFSIGQAATVNFNQLSASSVSLNRVVGNSASEIFGRLTANGQIFLVNNNGVLFARGSSVDVGGLFATSLSIANQDFLAGRYQFFNPGNAGAVINQGNIITANGFAALAAPQVRNDGVIIARSGSIALAAGDRVSLDIIGDGLISISVDQAALNASAINTGTIQADGGMVLLTARSANALLDTVINNSGVIRANSLVERNGEIVLDGGSTGVVSVTGTLEAAGLTAGTTGGTIKVLGDKVGLFDGANLNASGDAGGGTVLVGGNWQGKGPERNASATYMDSGATISADAVTTGDGGTVVVWSDNSTKVHGTISARGGALSGNGGNVETSGHYLDIAGARVDTRAPNGKGGKWLLDPFDVTIVDDAANTSAGGSFGGGDPNTWTPDGNGTSIVSDQDINDNLANTSVTITTVNANGTDAGDITVQDNVSIVIPTGTTLTLNAERNIDIGNASFAGAGASSVLALNIGQAGGNGTLTISADATLPSAASGTINVTGHNGTDAIVVERDANMTLTDSSLAVAGNYTLNLASIEVANLTGGASDNTFTVSNWTGTGALDGLGGSDSVIKSKDTNFTLSDSALTSADNMNLSLAGIEVANLTGGTGANTFTVANWTGNATLGGAAGDDVFNVTLSASGTVVAGAAGDNDTLNVFGTAGADAINVNATAVENGQVVTYAAAMEQVNVFGAGGSDTVTIAATAATSNYSVDGAGTATIVVSADANFTLTNTLLQVDDGGVNFAQANISLANVAAADLTGGASDNTFTVSGWTGTGTLDGSTGSDSVIASKDVNFTLSNAALTSNDSMSVALSSIEVANLTGGASDNSFTVGGWTGNATLDGAGGTGDRIFATNDVNFTLTSSTLARSGLTNLTLANIEAANLTGGVSDNIFDVSAWTGTGRLAGGGGSDTVVAIKDANFTLTNVNLSTSDGLNMCLSAIQVANLTGDASANTFTVNSFQAVANLDGGGGNDTFNLTISINNTYNVNGGLDTDTVNVIGGTGGEIFVISPTTVVRSGSNETVTYTGVENMIVQGAGGGDSFTFSGVAPNVTYAVHGGVGSTDTLNITALNENITLTLGTNDGTISNVGSFTTMETLIGANTLTGGPNWTITGNNSGTVNTGTSTPFTFSNTGNLRGTGGNETFTMAGGSLTGSIDGGGGTDTLATSVGGYSFNITGPNSGTVSDGNVTIWSNISNLAGGTGSDTFNGQGGTVATISDAAGGAATLSGTLQTSGVQNYSAPVTLNGATALNAGGALTFGSTVSGGSLTVTASTATFNGSVNTGSLSVTATNISAVGVTTSGDQTYTGTLSSTNSYSTGGGAFNVNGGTVLTGATTVDSGAGTATFNGTVNGPGGLTTNGTGLTTFVGPIGNTSALASLTTNSPTLFQGSVGTVNTTGNIALNGIVTSPGAITFNTSAGSFNASNPANDFQATTSVVTGGGALSLRDANNLILGPINAGAGFVTLNAGSLQGTGAVTGGSGSITSLADISGMGLNMPGNMAVSGTGGVQTFSFTVAPGASQPGSYTQGGDVAVFINNALAFPNSQHTNIGAVVGNAAQAAGAIIVEEANKTFGTDSVAEDIEYGFAGEIGATPPMDHRIDESGISLPRCVQESREGVPCK